MLVTLGMMLNKDDQLKIIGITGEAGSGKTTVTKLYAKSHNAYVILTDDVARELMEPGTECYKRVVQHFGEEILYSSFGMKELEETDIEKTYVRPINRAILADIVFNDENELKVLNSIVHSEVVSKVKSIITDIKSLNNDNNYGNIYSVILLESAILFQVEDLVKLCDEIWYVEARDMDRRERLKMEREYTDERIEAMSISQECIRQNKDRCDKIIINDRDIAELDNLLSKM